MTVLGHPLCAKPFTHFDGVKWEVLQSHLQRKGFYREPMQRYECEKKDSNICRVLRDKLSLWCT